MNDTTDKPAGNAFGVILFIAGLILAVIAYGQYDGEWVGKLAPAMLIGGPLIVAGAVLYAAGVIVAALRGR